MLEINENQIFVYKIKETAPGRKWYNPRKKFPWWGPWKYCCESIILGENILKDKSLKKLAKKFVEEPLIKNFLISDYFRIEIIADDFPCTFVEWNGSSHFIEERVNAEELSQFYSYLSKYSVRINKNQGKLKTIIDSNPNVIELSDFMSLDKPRQKSSLSKSNSKVIKFTPSST